MMMMIIIIIMIFYACVYSNLAIVFPHAFRKRHIFIRDLSGFCRIFPYYFIFWKNLLNSHCLICLSLQIYFEIFIILRRIQPDVVIKVRTSSCEVAVILVRYGWNLIFLDRYSKITQVSNFRKIFEIFSPTGAKLDSLKNNFMFMVPCIIIYSMK